LPGETADDFHAPAGFPEGPLDQVGVADAFVVVGWQVQVRGQAFRVSEETLRESRVGGLVGSGIARRWGDWGVGRISSPGTPMNVGSPAPDPTNTTAKPAAFKSSNVAVFPTKPRPRQQERVDQPV